MNDQPHWVGDAVFYGIDVARFFDANDDGVGDLAGVTAKLDHLRSLNVGCIWLLPFYPSDRADNGYAITDYIGVDVRLGKLDDFRELTRRAHDAGIRILVDLVMHHTSVQHPWFQAAESDENSRYREYYVWSKTKPADDESMSVFPHEEHGIWDFSERADAYYRHRFYRFQPDLRLQNEEVWDNVKRVIDFWVALGADGFRIDAATLMFSEPDDPPELFGERFDDLRAYLHARAPHAVLLGEADVRTQDVPSYLEHGRFDLLYDFLLNNAIYLGLARQSASPVIGELQRMRDTARSAPMLTFMRNLDELDLEQLNDDERDEVLRAFAPDPNTHIYGRGIRRSWAAMMHDDQQLSMTMSLLFALPGSPLLMYGQEIGMGDDLHREGRDAVRLPMQWSAEHAGGVTRHPDGELVRESIADADRGYRRVNVREQAGRDDSLLALVRRVSAIRAAQGGVGDDWECLPAPDALLVLRRGRLLTLHNLSDRAQRVEVPRDARPMLGVDPRQGGLPRYGFAWLELA